MYFVEIFVKNGRILDRFSGKIGQIVSQILENFSQILIISTLVCDALMDKEYMMSGYILNE